MTTSTLYLNHFQFKRVPFDQEPDVHIFFPAAGRNTILKNLLVDIESGIPLVKLTGSEGTGKTLMCRLFEQLVDHEKFILISVEHPVGSYENLLKTICLTLGTVEVEDDDRDEVAADYAALFKEHLQRIEAKGQRLILLVDEAENLFLATLERLIRFICEREESRSLQVFLVGRLDLDVNLEQLAGYCSSVDINAGYTLESLSFNETKQYMQFRLQMAGIPGEKYLDLFSSDALEMIFQGAMGNISLTNSFAEQGLKKACSQGMFQVDDELIQPPPSIEENVSLAFFQGYDFLKDHKWWLLLGVLLVWIALMLLWPASKMKEDIVEDATNVEIIVQEQPILIPTVPEVPELPGVPEVVEIPPVLPGDRQPVESQYDEPVEREEIPDPQKPVVKKKIAPQKEVFVEPNGKKKIKHSEKVVIEERTYSSSGQAEALFNERVKASSKWLAGSFRKGYTLQLMVLASENAEDNLKSILVDDKYYGVKDQLYILKKISPKTIYVFYGNYSSMDEARNARRKMPQFLKDIQPYALPIKDALKKIE